MSSTHQSATARTLKAAALVGAGAIGATLITGVAFAANNSPTASERSAVSTSRTPADMPSDAGFGDRGGMAGLARNFMHGDAVVKNDAGVAENLRIVVGDVTAVDAATITVRAADGYSQAFAISTDTVIKRSRQDAAATDIQVGDKAFAVGVVDGDTVTAKRIGAATPEQVANMLERRADKAANGGADDSAPAS